jgi:hypothetical protein
MQRFAMPFVLTVIALTMTACVAGTQTATDFAATGPLPQVLLGFWHGLIAPFMLLYGFVAPYIVPGYDQQWHVYEGITAGFSYHLGFCFGVLVWPFFLLGRARF